MKYLYIAAALVVSAILFVGCSKDDDETNSLEEYVAQCQNFLAENAKREGVVTTASGLQYEVLREGREDGKRPTAESQVRCHYQGTFIDGRVFDSSYASGSPIVFPLNGVIKGWTEGLQYMTEGAKYRFVIPFQLAYGPYGYATIPPYSTLIFEVELIEVL